MTFRSFHASPWYIFQCQVCSSFGISSSSRGPTASYSSDKIPFWSIERINENRSYPNSCSNWNEKRPHAPNSPKTNVWHAIRKSFGQKKTTNNLFAFQIDLFVLFSFCCIFYLYSLSLSFSVWASPRSASPFVCVCLFDIISWLCTVGTCTKQTNKQLV